MSKNKKNNVKTFEERMSKIDPNDYILYQTGKSEKYDTDLVEEDAEKGSIEIGKAEDKVEEVLTFHAKGHTAAQIGDMLDMPLKKVKGIIKEYGQNKKA